MKQTYLDLFGSGVWQQTTLRIDPDTGTAERRLYIAGGLPLWSAIWSAIRPSAPRNGILRLSGNHAIGEN